MLDTLAVSQELTASGLKAEQAAALTGAVRQAAEHGDHVTSEPFSTGLAGLRAEIAALEARLIKWMVGTVDGRDRDRDRGRDPRDSAARALRVRRGRRPR